MRILLSYNAMSSHSSLHIIKECMYRFTSRNVGGRRPRCNIAGKSFDQNGVRSARFQSFVKQSDADIITAHNNRRLAPSSHRNMVPIKFTIKKQEF